MSHKRVITSDGLRLAVFTHGDPTAPTVVAVHGYPDDHTVWDGVVAALREDHHVVTYDVRGAGASDAPRQRAGYHLDLLAADLAAVLDAVSPNRPVHLLAHDWGAIQTWHAVTGEKPGSLAGGVPVPGAGSLTGGQVTRGQVTGGRVASFTSISGPCLDHVGRWYRRRRTPRVLRELARQSARSWYTALFRLPLVPEVGWRSGLFGRVTARREHIPPPTARNAVNGLALYRENIAARMSHPELRRTDVPVQVLAPTRDRYVTHEMQADVGPYASDLRVRRIPGGHWLPRQRPEVIARCVRELVEHVEGAAEAPSLRRARAGTGCASAANRHAPAATGRWTDRLVVVTGGGSGIGRATALAFASRGAHVVVADRNLGTAQDTVGRTASAVRNRYTPSYLDRAGRPTAGADVGGAEARLRATAYQVDVADEAAMAEFAERVRTVHGVPDLVVNNAGIGMSGSFTDTTVADWQQIIDVNLWGVIHGCRLFAEQMREHGEGGHIVNVASAAAYLPLRTLSAYATTKSAVLTLSASLRAELHDHGIGVTAICPGFVHTNITATTRFVGSDAATEARRQAESTALYARRNYTPERVAEKIVRAVERDAALAPVTPEAHLGLLASRLTPGLVRAIARRDIGPR